MRGDAKHLGDLAVAELALLEQGGGGHPAVLFVGGVHGGLPKLLGTGVLPTPKRTIKLQSGDNTSAGVPKVAPLAERLFRGEFALVIVGRALITDPAWEGKTLVGRLDGTTPHDVAHLSTLH